MFKLNHIFITNRHEGLIVEGYLAKERMTFVSKYLNGIGTSLNRSQRNQEENDTKIDMRAYV